MRRHHPASKAQIDSALSGLVGNFSDQTIERGIKYASDGRVIYNFITIKNRPNKSNRTELNGLVRGSQENTYRSIIWWDNGSIRSKCSCPMMNDCKHVVATIIDFRLSGGTFEPELIRNNIPQAAQHQNHDSASAPVRFEQTAGYRWAESVAAAIDRSAKSGVSSNDWNTDTKERLLYELRISIFCEPRIELHKCRILRDGTISNESIKPYNIANAFMIYTRKPKFIGPLDEALCREIDAIRLTGFASEVEKNKNNGLQRRRMIHEIVETGRSFFDASGDRSSIIYLSWSNSRQAKLDWIEDDLGNSRLSLTDEYGKAIRIVETDCPLYLDPGSGEVGELSSDFPVEVLIRLAACPSLPQDTLPLVAAELKSMDMPALPLPKLRDARMVENAKPRFTAVLAATRNPMTGRVDRRSWSRDKGQEALRVMVKLTTTYDGQPVTEWKNPVLKTKDQDGNQLVIIRNRKEEDKTIASIKAAMADIGFALDHSPGSQFSGQAYHAFIPDESSTALAALTKKLIDSFTSLGVETVLDKTWPKRPYTGEIDLKARVHQGDDGFYAFDVEIDVAGDRESILDTVLEIVRKLPLNGLGELPGEFDLDGFLEDNQIWHRTAMGDLIRIPSDLLKPMVVALITTHNLRGRVHKARAAELADLVDNADDTISVEGLDEMLRIGRRLQKIANGEALNEPNGFVGTLRAYQRDGFGWMKALADLELGGCLADEMGTGKTVISLAYFVERHLGGAASNPSLIMAPASMLWTWAKEARKFAPDLKVVVLHGPERHAILKDVADHHVVITSYKLAHSDIAKLAAVEWDTVVLDEAHHVRNRDTKTAATIRKLHARVKFALTGTPINNHLEDLWSLFDWAIPGLLGSRSAFRAEFRTPIERDGCMITQARLNRLVRPFLLRRTKKDVANDLPEKNQIVESIRLGNAQRALYETIRIAMLAEVTQAISERGVQESKTTILTCLMKLRQVCCDPRLLSEDDAAEIGSAKLDHLIEMIETRLDEGGKVVVFSQFVKMLDLISDELDKSGIEHFAFTGSTPVKKRLESVERFQAGERPVFLISLHAGGEGITLTEADTVMLFDSWWSPTAEAQAQDRVHRIGQEKEVFVYRLVCENTVEEQIIERQERKAGLAEALWTGEASGSPFDMTEEEVYALFGASSDAIHEGGALLARS